MIELPDEVKASMFKKIGNRFIPNKLIDILPAFTWQCACGTANMGLYITKKGSIYGHCRSCGLRFFIHNYNILVQDDPFSFTKTKAKIVKCKNGVWSFWYPTARVRIFSPKRKRPKLKKLKL